MLSYDPSHTPNASPETAPQFPSTQIGRSAADLSGLVDRAATQGDSAKLTAALRALQGLPTSAESQGFNSTEVRDSVLAKYSISVLSDSQVRLVIPAGVTRAQFLWEVQAVAKQLHGCDPISNEEFKRWMQDSRFIQQQSQETVVCVDGSVSGSGMKTRAEQDKFLAAKGLVMAELADLVVAHAAFYLATGKDIFKGNTVRARDGVVWFIKDVGVCEFDYASQAEFVGSKQTASATLPEPA